MKNNIYQSFVDNLKTEEQDIVKALDSFIKYLGFDDFEKSDVTGSYEALSTEVYGFDDRRVFISAFYENNIKCRYVITDNNCNVFDNIVFEKDGNKWVESKNISLT